MQSFHVETLEFLRFNNFTVKKVRKALLSVIKGNIFQIIKREKVGITICLMKMK